MASAGSKARPRKKKSAVCAARRGLPPLRLPPDATPTPLEARRQSARGNRQGGRNLGRVFPRSALFLCWVARLLEIFETHAVLASTRHCCCIARQRGGGTFFGKISASNFCPPLSTCMMVTDFSGMRFPAAKVMLPVTPGKSLVRVRPSRTDCGSVLTALSIAATSSRAAS